MLRNENIPVVHQEHAYDDADVALTMALPWVHELGWPLTTVRLAAGPVLFATREHRRRFAASVPLLLRASRPPLRGGGGCSGAAPSRAASRLPAQRPPRATPRPGRTRAHHHDPSR